MSNIIEFRDVCFSVRDRPILQNISFVVNSGETLVLLGRSGSGKTTILKLINALLRPTGGDVLFNGASTSSWDLIRLRRQIGYVIQEVGLLPHYTVARNIGLLPELENWPVDKVSARVRELLELVGLDPGTFGKRFPRELSGGQRQRVGIARALAVDPPVLVLDEPFGALDPITRAEVRREFRQLQRQVNKTMIFVTHDVQEAFHLATHIGLVKEGRLLELVPPAEFRKLHDPEAKAFVESLD